MFKSKILIALPLILSTSAQAEVLSLNFEKEQVNYSVDFNQQSVNPPEENPSQLTTNPEAPFSENQTEHTLGVFTDTNNLNGFFISEYSFNRQVASITACHSSLENIFVKLDSGVTVNAPEMKTDCKKIKVNKGHDFTVIF